MYTDGFAGTFVSVISIILLPWASTLTQQTPIPAVHERTILFVCEHGSAKSVIAAAHFNDVAAKNGLPYRAIARGVHPDKEVPPYITSGLAAEGLNIRGWQPKRFGENDARRAERVITLGCVLPTSKAFAAGKLQDWSVPSPSENYQNASRAIAERVALLLRALAGKQTLQ
jgi:arsenate reductase (thioredoxin)